MHVKKIAKMSRPQGGVYSKHSRKTCLDEDIVEAAPSFNLMDEENDDEELEIL